MKPIRCMIVEDELMARLSLEKLCKKIEQLEVTGVFENALDAFEKLQSEKIDLLFLDIQMPGMTGLDLLDQLPYLPLVIFTTSNTEYAFDAYEYDVTDFLKKPIAMPRLLKAMEKVNQRLDQLNDVAASSAHTEIYIKTDGRFIRIPFSEIFFFENVGDYIKAVTTMGNFIFYSTIKALDQKISNPRFLKVHRSFIVNLDKIKDIEDNTLVIEKSVIPISRAHKNLLLQSINIL
ncbi:MAG: response regulator transcription factor [Haliscomenobacter sp.]|nr:response regulator transcription factor [Haliscomenobacter sp.]MBK8653830.1 response regulator transcription factor [Haliscomenobacter sp.]